MVRPTLVTLAKRVPLIHFRKGGVGAPGAQSAHQQASSQPAGGKKVNPAHFINYDIRTPGWHNNQFCILCYLVGRRTSNRGLRVAGAVCTQAHRSRGGGVHQQWGYSQLKSPPQCAACKINTNVSHSCFRLHSNITHV